MVVWSPFFISCVLFAGFKATLSYEKCLETRNATVAAWQAARGGLTSGTSALMTALSSTDMPPDLPECNLEEELNSVRHPTRPSKTPNFKISCMHTKDFLD